MTLVLSKSDDSLQFEGFQIICAECEFPYIERSVVAQLNKGRYCNLTGRVSHTDPVTPFLIPL